MNKLIKGVYTTYYSLELHQENNRYVVKYKNSKMNNLAQLSFKQLNIALDVFSEQHTALEGQ
jgi:hypothetical protein